MDPLTALGAAITLVEFLAPRVQEMIDKNEVSPEAQALLRARLDALRTQAAFAGPEWKLSTQQG